MTYDVEAFKEKYKLKITLNGMDSCVMTLDEGAEHIASTANDLEQMGEVWSFELVEMSAKELSEMPEFTGW